MECPDVERLEAYLDDVLEAPARTAIDEHLGDCAPCRKRLDELRANLSTLALARDAWSDEPVDSKIGPANFRLPGYDLLRTVYEGGQGVIYAARQHATDRLVAIKVLLRGPHATRRQRHRFEREIELAAALDHPGIVPVLDNGIAPDGRRFLVMPYVEGRTLDRALSDTPREINHVLDLFTQITEAVRYAHQRGVIHRDLKPGNILVDDVGEPHLLDFGLAQPVERLDAARPSMQTQAGEFVGTLAYAAPEQLGGDPHAIDVRSDLYALGMILFEMLTGALAFMLEGRLPEVLRHLADDEPRRASSVRRGIDHELDTIIAKLLNKDKARRYQSASGLLRDLENYRAGRPIEAKASSTFYVLRKTARRYRVPIAAVLVVIASLIVATTIAVGAARTAERERQRTVSALDRSEVEARKAAAINEFLTDMISSVRPDGRKEDVTVREALDRASATVATSFAAQPETEAAVRSTIGSAYWTLGSYEEAEHQLRLALATFESLGDDDRDQADTLLTMNRLAVVRIDRGDFDEAERLLDEATEGLQTLVGPDDPRSLTALHNLGFLYQRQGRRQEAQPIWERALAGRRRALGDDHPETLRTLNNLGWLALGLGQSEKAESLIREAHEHRVRTLGPDHPDSLGSATSLAFLLGRLNRLDEAESILVPALARQRELLGDEHLGTIYTRNFLGWTYVRQGRFDDAETMLTETVAICRRAHGPGHPATLQAMSDLASMYSRQGRIEEAEPLMREALASRRSVLGAEHPATINTTNDLAVICFQQSKHAEARVLFSAALEARTRSLGPEHPQTIGALYNLATVDEAEGLTEKAATTYGEVLAMSERIIGPLDRSTIKTRQTLAMIRANQGRLAEAEAILLEGYRFATADPGGDENAARAFAQQLVPVYEALENPEEADRYRALAEGDETE